MVSLKVHCEMEARAIFGDKALIVRPASSSGPGDLADRHCYWPGTHRARLMKCSLPGTPDDSVAFIDARDLASG
jgi:2'-hydroxyisoflavone reductase